MSGLFRRADELLLDLCYPDGVSCLVCGRPAHGLLLCDFCAVALEADLRTAPRCPVCDGLLEEDGTCLTCLRFGPMAARSQWRHSGAARQLVLRLKHQAAASAAPLLAAGMAEAARSLDYDPEDTVITWVTMPEKRRRQRGIDHGQQLAMETARLLGLPCRQLLTRREDAELAAQAGLDRAARLKNLQGTMDCPQQVRGTVLLCDDVLTTGATARAAATCLEGAGASRVLTVTATRAER